MCGRHSFGHGFDLPKLSLADWVSSVPLKFKSIKSKLKKSWPLKLPAKKRDSALKLALVFTGLRLSSELSRVSSYIKVSKSDS